MVIRLSVATAPAGTLIATCFVSGSAQATSMPVLKSDSPHGLLTLVGRGGHGHGGGGHGHGGGGKHHAYRGGGYGHYYRHKHYGHQYRGYGYYGWYGWPGYHGGGCGWLYRRAVATGSPYWWNRYYECIGY